MTVDHERSLWSKQSKRFRAAPWSMSIPFMHLALVPSRPDADRSRRAIFNDTDKAEKMFPVPVLQVLQVKQMQPSGTTGERWRLVVSDGQYYVQTMLATKANHVIHEGKLQRGCVVRVKQYQPNNLKGKK